MRHRRLSLGGKRRGEGRRREPAAFGPLIRQICCALIVCRYLLIKHLLQEPLLHVVHHPLRKPGEGRAVVDDGCPLSCSGGCRSRIVSVC